MQFKIFSFFSGAGFLDLGFEDEKFNIVYVNEYNQSFLDVYKFARNNMNKATPQYGYFCGDINKIQRGNCKKTFSQYVSEAKENSIVGFIGGPPCPDFSVAGKNEGIKGENGRLTNTYKRVIITQKPDFFVFENVKGLLFTQKHRTEYNKIKNELSKNGYILIDKLVNSLEYGVPQERERVILFGIKFDLLDNDKNIAQQILLQNFTWHTSYNLDTIQNCSWPTTTPFVKNGELKAPDNILLPLTVQYWFDKNNVNNHTNSNDYFIPHSKRFSSIDEGDVSKKSFKRLHRWRFSPTVAYGNNEVHLHPYKERRLSVAEALALQSLPKEFIVPNNISKSDMFKTIGNGVPYLLARGIAKSIYIFINDNIKV